MKIESALNSEQLAPALDITGAVLVTAGAGSGKTRLLTHRIAHLIEDEGVPAYKILAITFTNKAAQEMKNRLADMLPGGDEVWVSTFHSMCVRMLRRYADRIGYKKNFTIYADDETERTVKRIVKDLNLEGDSVHKKCIYAISDAKNQGLSPEKYQTVYSYVTDIDIITKVYSAYEEELRGNNALDFDDLLTKTYDLLSTCPDVLEYYQNKFEYIHVDEFQDTNTVQYNLIKLLAGKRNSVFVVGDEDQSIYGWRGADVTNMRKFIEEFNAKIYKLERNYRSTKKILDAANSLIQNNKSRIEKTLWTDAEGGKSVAIYRGDSDAAEAEYVVKNIKKMVDEGSQLQDFAILVRVNAMTRVLEQRLVQYNIPYKVYGGFKFFDRKEVKDILAYLKVFSNTDDNESLLRIINFPKRGIGNTAQAQLVNYCNVENKRLFDVITNISSNPDLPSTLIKKFTPFSELLNKLSDMLASSNSVYEFTSELVEEVDFKGVYAEDTEENHSRILNIDDFLAGVKDFSDKRKGTLLEYLEEVTLYATDDEYEANCVYLSSIHSAKGMEFKHVFIIGLEEGLFPINRAREDDNEMEEERRLMYVAITRAKERLFLTFCLSRFMYGERKVQMPSRFFTEIDASLESKLMPQSSGKSVADTDEGYSKKYSAPQVSPLTASQPTPRTASVNAADYEIGSRVKHKRFGEGTVESLSNLGGNTYLTIKFDAGSKMTLSLQFAPLEKVK